MGDEIKDAYKSVIGSAVAKDSSQSTKQNLWEFLGLNNAKPDQVACMFDCSMNGSNCLKKCNKEKNSSECQYGCSSKGIKCFKSCVVEKIPPPIPTTTVDNSDDYDGPLNSNCVNIKGSCNSIDYAPYNSKLWPQYSPNSDPNNNNNSNNSNMGWDISEIYDSNKSLGDTEFEIDLNKYKYIAKKDKTETELEKEKQLLRDIKWDPHKIATLSSKFRDDKEFMLKAISENWRALEYASDKLKTDKEVVNLAVRQNWVALQYAGDDFKPVLEWV